jgi:hypothetical protein
MTDGAIEHSGERDLVVWGLCTEGSAIVKASTYAEVIPDDRIFEVSAGMTVREVKALRLPGEALASLTFSDLEEWGDDEEFPLVDSIEMAIDIDLQAAMLDDLPDEIISRFELAYESTLDGALGRVDDDQLEDVKAALEASGYSFEQQDQPEQA